MKKKITVIFSILYVTLSAQQANAFSYNGGLFAERSMYQVPSNNAKRNLSYDEIQGTPYYEKNFSLAKFVIPENVETAPARYNIYLDEVEFIKDDKTYALPPDSPFKKIEFINTGETLVKLNNGDELSGYFFEIVNGKYSLYKKLKMKFNDFVPAPNSYAMDKPANFHSFDPLFYIRTEKGFIKKPKNQKEIIEQIPDKKDVLTTFFKENKIKFDKEEDLKKLVNFLNQN
ncbi:hypothetical protein JI747_005800 [Chryseobacterium sp. RG1]|uniref:GLPGLI family protein n=1 Tax=Chryseobacterium tagetis TaxID=2801334 RepID=A0ABS8A012_9FLAO|nr:hypothetical protein [Chryseobacterium tagetis]MCA6066683.1 hypothetical protein [Chryseobacterium tagetis]